MRRQSVKFFPRVGLQWHTYFKGFFKVPVQALTLGQPFLVLQRLDPLYRRGFQQKSNNFNQIHCAIMQESKSHFTTLIGIWRTYSFKPQDPQYSISSMKWPRMISLIWFIVQYIQTLFIPVSTLVLYSPFFSLWTLYSYVHSNIILHTCTSTFLSKIHKIIISITLVTTSICNHF